MNVRLFFNNYLKNKSQKQNLMLITMTSNDCSSALQEHLKRSE